MRIVRPGSVVGPQQQYMYLKQLEWCKWAAVHEVQKHQATSASASPMLVTPATPPAETDEEIDAMASTPPPTIPSGILPPVTPSKHVAAAAAKAKAIAPPGQPRKTPSGKRVAVDSDQEDADDVLPALGVVPVTKLRVKSMRASGSRVTASEQRPTRVTRSTAGAIAIRKMGAGTPSSVVPSTRSTGQGPNKIPRLATTRNTAAAKAATPAVAPTRRPLRSPPSPTPSRLPTLIPAKRPHHVSGNSLSEVASATLKRPGTASDAWMKNNTSKIVVPASKTERPGLRSVRRRRSSFSAADVVA